MAGTEIHMLKLYAVKVWYTSDPPDCEDIEVRTYTARRAQLLAVETYPGCNAHTLGVFIEGSWRCATQDA
jgi:hypothetical protein